MTPINARKATSFLRKKKKTINFARKIIKIIQLKIKR